MNKTIASLAALVLCTTALKAQDDVSVRFGLKLSPNMAFVNPDTKTLKSNGSGLGYTFGLMLELPVGNTGNYRFATGLNLNNIKGKWKRDFEYLDAIGGPIKVRELETEVGLQYIELPLTMKLMTNEIGYMRYFAVVGAGNAFNVQAKADQVLPKYDQTGGYVVDFEKEEKADIKDDIALYKASLIVGAGAEYNFSGNTSVMFGITYNNGFTNILDIDGMRAKAHYLELSLGVFF